jgi:hypothetical protein
MPTDSEIDLNVQKLKAEIEKLNAETGQLKSPKSKSACAGSVIQSFATIVTIVAAGAFGWWTIQEQKNEARSERNALREEKNQRLEKEYSDLTNSIAQLKETNARLTITNRLLEANIEANETALNVLQNRTLSEEEKSRRLIAENALVIEERNLAQAIVSEFQRLGPRASKSLQSYVGSLSKTALPHS